MEFYNKKPAALPTPVVNPYSSPPPLVFNNPFFGFPSLPSYPMYGNPVSFCIPPSMPPPCSLPVPATPTSTGNVVNNYHGNVVVNHYSSGKKKKSVKNPYKKISPKKICE